MDEITTFCLFSSKFSLPSSYQTRHNMQISIALKASFFTQKCTKIVEAGVSPQTRPLVHIAIHRLFEGRERDFLFSPNPNFLAKPLAAGAPPQTLLGSACSTHCWRGWGERWICFQSQFLGYATLVNSHRTRSFLFDLKCTKIAGGWGSAPDPAGGAYSKTAVVLIGDVSGTQCSRHIFVSYSARAPSDHVVQAWAIPHLLSEACSPEVTGNRRQRHNVKDKRCVLRLK